MTRPCRSLHLYWTLVLACAALGVWTPALAQPPESTPPASVAADPPAHVSFVDGAAVLERDGQPDSAPSNMPLLAGDRIRTQGGRVEILFADGSTLHLDANTTMDFQSDELVRLLDGRIRLAIPGPDRRVAYRIDAPSASAVIFQPGEYRLSVLHTSREPEIELAVLRGAAELVNDDGRTPLRAGERAYARANAAPSYAYVFNSASWDAFDRWSEARRDQRLGVSAQYLPDEVRPYATSFDRYGSWRYEPTYGHVWYPTVAVDWRPYYRGRWVTLRPYGWTWVGLDPFAWPTHHFGRWGFSAGAWFWIPGRTWGPAWVSWAYAPGYVSWCPLGWNNRPVIQFVNVNVYSRGYDPWRAWTVVPRRHFGVDYVNVHYVAGNRFDARVWRTFEPRQAAPATSGYAVPRSSAPIRVAGTGAGRRSNSTVYTNLEPGASRVPPGDRRVMVGPSRSSVAPLPSPGERTPGDGYAVRRGTPADPSRRSAEGAEADESRRSQGIAAVPSPAGDERARRAVPRDQPVYRTPAPSGNIYAPGADRGAAATAPRANDYPSPGYRADSPYGRRAPMTDRPAPSGVAVPRSSPPDAARPEPRPYGGVERRAPGMDRPQGPPPDAGRPVAQPREYRSAPPPAPPPSGGDRRGPGSDRGQQAPAPPPAAGGGHQRGGGQATGRAVPRGGGR
jgi:hypothetical protein